MEDDDNTETKDDLILMETEAASTLIELGGSNDGLNVNAFISWTDIFETYRQTQIALHVHRSYNSLPSSQDWNLDSPHSWSSDGAQIRSRSSSPN